METQPKRTRQDEIIEYLMNSKRELQREIAEDAKTQKFKDAIIELRERKKQRENAL